MKDGNQDALDMVKKQVKAMGAIHDIYWTLIDSLPLAGQPLHPVEGPPAGGPPLTGASDSEVEGHPDGQ